MAITSTANLKLQKVDSAERLSDYPAVQASNMDAIDKAIGDNGSAIEQKASKSDLSATDSNVTALTGRIDTTDSNVTALTGRIDTTDSNVTALGKRVGNLPVYFYKTKPAESDVPQKPALVAVADGSLYLVQ